MEHGVDDEDIDGKGPIADIHISDWHCYFCGLHNYKDLNERLKYLKQEERSFINKYYDMTYI